MKQFFRDGDEPTPSQVTQRRINSWDIHLMGELGVVYKMDAPSCSVMQGDTQNRDTKKPNAVVKLPKLDLRGAGIMLPISALPSRHGIGTFGEAAHQFLRELTNAGQQYWQVLPLLPTPSCNSPFQSFSAFAGNCYFIDLDILVSKGLLKEDEIAPFVDQSDTINYGRIYATRRPILQKAFARANKVGKSKEAERFEEENAEWLESYCLYRAIKAHFGDKPWMEWPEAIRWADKGAKKEYARNLADEIAFWKFCQFEFENQWQALKANATKSGIAIIGDCPLYVSLDSADVWEQRHLFKVEKNGNVKASAGVPPDAYSDMERCWGNPLYDWPEMERENFTWWKKRMKRNACLYNIIRIDHFIGLRRFYKIHTEPDECHLNRWEDAPGLAIAEVIEAAAKEEGGTILAEDLGLITPDVREVLEKIGWQGMKVLQFAFDGKLHNDHLPHNYKTHRNVVYPSTHDNETLQSYLHESYPEKREQALEYTNTTLPEEIVWNIHRLAYMSIADTVIILMQDILELDNSARTNIPGKTNGWCWRLKEGQFTKVHQARLRKLAETYGRLPSQKNHR